MNKNIFEELQERKSKIIKLALKGVECNWITELECKSILNKLDQDILTIGVIGQMKCGKSTFLNAFVFEDDVLPAATTPMTASLSVITYGEDKKLIAEFYSVDEWEEQKITASRSLDEVHGNALEESKIKAAKELVECSEKLGPDLYKYLGKTQEDILDRLEDYVGAQGKFISITKAVTIYYPKEYLKGVEIVDTPGFNDPIVSREERTKKFLKKADVVLMMLYAGRPFDATDSDILFNNVQQCGTGKVLIGINKYDIPYENGETIEEIKDYVKNQLRTAYNNRAGESLKSILRQTDPIPFSAEMALLSKLPMKKITSSETYTFSWNRACDNFEISSQSQMHEISYICNLSQSIQSMIENEKGAILFSKPINLILAKGDVKKTEIEKKISLLKLMIQNLSLSDDELSDKMNNLNKAERKLNKKIDRLGEDLQESFRNTARAGNETLEDVVDNACKKMRKEVEGLGRFESQNSLKLKIQVIMNDLITRKLDREIKKIEEAQMIKIKNELQVFCFDVQEVIQKHIPDFEERDFIKSITMNVDFSDINDSDNSEDLTCKSEKSGFSILSLFSEIGAAMIDGIMNVATLGFFDKITNAISHENVKNENLEWINELQGSFNAAEFLQSITDKKDVIIKSIKHSVNIELLGALKSQIEEIQSKVSNREEKLQKANEELTQLSDELILVNKQIKEIEILVNQ